MRLGEEGSVGPPREDRGGAGTRGAGDRRNRGAGDRQRPGGLAAAMAASRAGVRAMVVERFGCPGGNITVVGVESTAWYRREGTVDCEGIASSSRSPRDGVDGADVNVA